MPASSAPSVTSKILGAVSNTPFVNQQFFLTLSGLNLLQQICNALFGVSAVTQQSTFDNLPSSPELGWSASITDSNTNTWGAVIGGGGAHTVMGWFNGTNWTVIGK